jgi:hypothetical protein
MFDQWAGIVFEQLLHQRGLTQVKMVNNTKPRISEFFKNFKDLMWQKRLNLYDFPIPEGKLHCDYIAELLELQVTVHSKYVITVEAPSLEGKHDDLADALVRMVWLATQRIQKPHQILAMYPGMMMPALRGNLSEDRRNRKIGLRRGMGSSPERMTRPRWRR